MARPTKSDLARRQRRLAAIRREMKKHHKGLPSGVKDWLEYLLEQEKLFKQRFGESEIHEA